MHVTSQTTVAAPIETVWDKLSDHVGMSEWGPVTVTMDRLGTADPNGVGAIRRIALPGPGPDIVEEVVTFEAPNLLRLQSPVRYPISGLRRRGTADPCGFWHAHQLHRLHNRQLPAGQGAAGGGLSGAASPARACVHEDKQVVKERS